MSLLESGNGGPAGLSIPPGLALAAFATVGRSLIATRAFAEGDVVLSDAPALEWDPSLPLPADVEALRREQHCDSGDGDGDGDDATATPHNFAAAAVAFEAATDEVRRTVLDMHVPELPVKRAAWRLLAFAKGMAARAAAKRAGDGASLLLSPEAFARAMLAAKVNSHRGAGGTWRLFPLASKLAHSCAPNCMYVQDGGTFVAVRPILAGEMLSFSYVGGALLAQATELRQRRLLSSHLFVCRCHRCLGRDACRQLRCPACNNNEGDTTTTTTTSSSSGGFIARLGSAISVLDTDHFPGRLWQCDRCGREFTDAALEPVLAVEATLVEAVLRASSSGLKYKELKALALLVARQLGPRHWAFGEVCNRLMHYFRMLVSHGCDAARHLVAAWGLKYMVHLHLVGLTLTPSAADNRSDSYCGATAAAAAGDSAPPRPRFPHMLCCSTIITIVGAIADEAPYRALSAHLSKLAAPLVVALHGAHDARAQNIFAVAARLGCDDTGEGGAGHRHTQLPLGAAELQATAPPIINVDPRGLFALWDRIVALTVMRQVVEESGGAVPAAATPGLSQVGGSNASMATSTGSSFEGSEMDATP